MAWCPLTVLRSVRCASQVVTPAYLEVICGRLRDRCSQDTHLVRQLHLTSLLHQFQDWPIPHEAPSTLTLHQKFTLDLTLLLQLIVSHLSNQAAPLVLMALEDTLARMLSIILPEDSGAIRALSIGIDGIYALLTHP